MWFEYDKKGNIKRRIIMKQLIYRIEDENGNGFYNSYGDSYGREYLDHEARVRLHLFKKRHVAPIHDIGIDRCSVSGEKCGFINEEQLYTWIDRSKIRRLEKFGFKLVRLYREVIAVGKYQILFSSRP